MQIKVTINMDNEAFGDTPGYETARILRDLADKLDIYGIPDITPGKLRDSNGNTVGTVEVR